MYYPQLQPLKQFSQVQDVFLGLNANQKTDPREWADMTNLSPRDFPMFAPREPRGIIKTLTAPAGILARDALVYVDGPTLYINDLPVTGLVLLTGAEYVPKQLVSMGAYIIVMPDKMYVNTADLSDYGHIDSVFSYTGTVTLTPARVDGSDVPDGAILIGVEPPAEPMNGDYWIDTTKDTHVLKQYSAESAVWTVIYSTYTKIAMPGVGAYFEPQDGVEIAGVTFEGTDPDLLKQTEALNGIKVIGAKHDNYIIVPGLLGQVVILQDATITIKREMPQMDFLTESENRLWGCFYGVRDGKAINEIYACAQGDFKNWNKFAGVSTDSYAASVGTDGVFTGAVTYQGYPLFLKETALHKVYGGMPANYRIETYACRGLQQGSWRSMQIVNELLFFKGRTDVLVYDGSDPVSVSKMLGADTYRDAVAGAFKHLYYISMKDSAKAWHLFVYDTRLRMWFREDATQALGFAQVDDDLYFIDEATGNIISAFGKSGTAEADVAFSATTGIIGFESKDYKYVSRIVLRGKVAAGASLNVYFRYDSAGAWELAGTVTGAGVVKSAMLPVRPKRCDHFEMKLTGTGDVRVFSIATIREYGGDGGGA